MIILRMVKGRRCRGCSATRRTDERSGLCTDCAGLAIEVADRKQNLDGTVDHLFARKLLERRTKARRCKPIRRTI